MALLTCCSLLVEHYIFSGKKNAKIEQVPLTVRFPQHECLLDRPINQVISFATLYICLDFGDLLMNFLYFFGNVFDPWQMRISVQGSGVYIKREKGCSIDPTH
ncbi:putative PAP/25A-associated [Rosa chinensis]|uniref:Putative PAP/25A-associated n=1 Tax=Rosa chinensis TaxID=74649 RepID=A0A2P6QEV2_ROSCH|nr:putative PAP/25A-associated [Rosa chinensis]